MTNSPIIVKETSRQAKWLKTPKGKAYRRAYYWRVTRPKRKKERV